MIIEKRHTIISNQVFENVLLENNNNDWQPQQRNGSIIEAGKDTLVPVLIQAIQTAKKMICLQSFLIQEMAVFEAIEAAQENGVKVFILTSNAHLANAATEEEESFHRGSYVKMLKEKIQSKMLLRSANWFHAKFILIDPNTENAKGFLTTANFTQEPLEENPELGVRLDKQQVMELFQLFVYHFWECATHEQNNSKVFTKVKPRKTFEVPKTESVLFLSKASTQLKDSVIEIIRNATKQIVISSFNYDVKNEIGQLLFQKMKAGIEVILFVPERKKVIFNQIDQLLQAGAKVYVQPKLHAKFLVCDNENGCIMSANFDSIIGDWFETGVILSNNQVVELNAIIEDWKIRFSKKMIAKTTINDAPKKLMQFTHQEDNLSEINIKQTAEKGINLKNPTISKIKQLIEQQKTKNTKVFYLDLKLNIYEYRKDIEIVKELSPNINLIEIKSGKKMKQVILIEKDFDLEKLLHLSSDYQNLEIFSF